MRRLLIMVVGIWALLGTVLPLYAQGGSSIPARGTTASPIFSSGQQGLLPAPNPTLLGNILYNQFGFEDTSGATSQRYTNIGNTVYSADDFTIPSGTWTIAGMEARMFDNTPENGSDITDARVIFYHDNAGKPGSTACQPSTASYSANFVSAEAFTLSVEFSSPCVLGPGTYWVTIYPYQNSEMYGSIYWFQRPMVNTSFYFYDPGDITSLGCTTWSTASDCGFSDPYGLSFRLRDYAYSLNASRACNNGNLNINITSGDQPFTIKYSLNGITQTPVLAPTTGVYTLPGTGAKNFTNIMVIEEGNDLESMNLPDINCAVPLDVVLSCDTTNSENLNITILAGDGPFHITASAGVNLPRYNVGVGTTIIDGPEKWDNVTVTENDGNFQSINFGQFKCYPNGRPTQLSPTHRARTTNPYPVFSWLSFPEASNYRVWLFDDPDLPERTVDIRQNSGGALSMSLSRALSPGRYFWRMRARVNRIWSRWSTRWALFIDPAADPAQLPVVQINADQSAPAITTNPTVLQPTSEIPVVEPTSTPLPPPNTH